MWYREHRELLSYSLNKLYRSIGISKQSVLKYEERRRQEDETLEQMLEIVNQVRKDHPGMGLRTIYEKMRPSGIGRDKFEEQCMQCGLGVVRPRNWRCTTDSRGVKRFDNKLKDFTPTKPDQAWLSDITYYEINNRFYYLTFIEDLYTRYVKGHSVSSTLRTEDTTIPALKQAVRGRELRPGIIIHSDGGGQYYSKEFLKITSLKKFRNSMGKDAYENPHAERLNGTIKNQYLKYRKIRTQKDLEREVARSVRMYNEGRPHKSLYKLTPLQAENGELKKAEQRIRRNKKNAGRRGSLPLITPAKQKRIAAQKTKKHLTNP